MAPGSASGGAGLRDGELHEMLEPVDEEVDSVDSSEEVWAEGPGFARPAEGRGLRLGVGERDVVSRSCAACGACG